MNFTLWHKTVLLSVMTLFILKLILNITKLISNAIFIKYKFNKINTQYNITQQFCH